ncbi:MAG: epoxyqueuosine reductase QueH [Eubacteriales bacterium]|jgi:predicted adenine nucleotide alpha hydrolase (AANH) superfamily ATPase|nr:epoxyqueuosine reductase QueH [Eubacteriales bacterium]
MTKKNGQYCNLHENIRYNSSAGDNAILSFSDIIENKRKPTLLLHSCCGPCSTAVIERLISKYRITVFFYNPNITDPIEYEKRKETQLQFINEYNNNLMEDKINFIEGEYLPQEFFEITSDFSDEPEGGARCTLCFEMRLAKTAFTAREQGFDMFATTLTVSPHKNYNLISEIGNNLATEYSVEFLDLDFKKKAGFQRSIQLSKEYNLYRQNYCGCQYSKR